LRADCLYRTARLAKPGHRCRLLQGTQEIKPSTPLAALDLSLGTCIQVVWIANYTDSYKSHSNAFAAIKANGSVVTWGRLPIGSTPLGRSPTEGVVRGCATHGAFAAIKAGGSVVTWGDIQRGGDSSAVAALLTEGVVQVVATDMAFAALKANGSVLVWFSYTLFLFVLFVFVL
jgi:hypothetical protein